MRRRLNALLKETQTVEVHFPPEIEGKLIEQANQQGREPGELAGEIVMHHFLQEARLLQAVERGEDALRRGEYLTHEEVGRKLQRFFREWAASVVVTGRH